VLDRLLKRQKFNVHFNRGAFLEVEKGRGNYVITMAAADTVIHQDTLEARQWTQSHQQFYTEWKIEVKRKNGKQIFAHQFDLANRRVRVNIDSKSLGDTLAWLPQVQAFASQHPQSQVFVSQFWPDLFDLTQYKNLTFITPDSVLDECYATYNIGYYFDNSQWYHPLDFRQQPLGKIAADILGIDYQERLPHLQLPDTQVRSPGKRVCIATASTAACKFWNRNQGWQTVVDYLIENEFEVVVIQQEETELVNVTDETGNQPIGSRIEQLLQCDYFIGLGSGLSWLAWAVGKPVVLISGFSMSWAEFQTKCYRVINHSSCHGCWNDPELVFDRGDWDWCPRHKDTPRQYECTKSITAEMVIRAIEELQATEYSGPL